MPKAERIPSIKSCFFRIRGRKNAVDSSWYTYIVECSDGSYYTGISTDVKKRVSRHNSGKASKYTRARRPVKLLYVEEFLDSSQAKRREREIKSFRAENKRRLVKYGAGVSLGSYA